MDKQQELLEAVMKLIMFGGDAKSHAVEAIRAAKAFQFDLAEEKLQLAQQSLSLAHHGQTDLLTQEAKGDKGALSLLMVHGQDHLMNAITFLARQRRTVRLPRSVIVLGFPLEHVDYQIHQSP
mgnify:CR=1 FL=1